MANLIFDRNTELTAGQAAKLEFVTNKEVNQAPTTNANKTLAMVAEGFGIENMFYKTEEVNSDGELYYRYTAHSSKTAELEALLRGE